jgi:hypothetical protein
VAQLTSDATAISKLANANAKPYQLAITDSLPNIVGDLSALDANSHVASLTATSGSATLKGGATIAAPAFALTGSATALTLAEILTYSGSFSEGAGSTVSISSGDTLTLSGTTSLSGKVIGKGTLALAGGATTLNRGASISVSSWKVSGSGTSVTLGESLTYAGTFSAGSGTTLNGSGTLAVKGASTVAGFTIGGTTTFSDSGALSETGGSARPAARRHSEIRPETSPRSPSPRPGPGTSSTTAGSLAARRRPRRSATPGGSRRPGERA